ncbi:MAG: 4-(cytidine 5'-diphospho)-2-C-methyl-D-erythritol kinase [Rickettsiales bacterium]
MKRAVLLAPAKLNLYLRVLGKNAQGYHALESAVTFVNLCDAITLVPIEEKSDRLSVVGPFAEGAGEISRNIVLKALFVARRIGEEQGETALPFFDVSLEKNIPCGAGLGGGSADAGAILRHFFPVSDEAVMREALRLGADVPACVYPHRDYIASGIGERLRPAIKPFLPEGAGVVIVYPHAHYSTEDIFCRYASTVAPTTETEQKAETDAPQGYDKNDLEEAAGEEAKETLARLRELREASYARMTGSGSACFAVFPDGEKANRAAVIIKERLPDAFVTVTRRFSTNTTRIPKYGWKTTT